MDAGGWRGEGGAGGSEAAGEGCEAEGREGKSACPSSQGSPGAQGTRELVGLHIPAESVAPCAVPFCSPAELLPPSVYLVTCAIHGTPEARAGGGREGEFTSLPLQWLCSSWNTMDTHAHRDTWTHKQQTHTNRQRHTWTQIHTNIQRHRYT